MGGHPKSVIIFLFTHGLLEKCVDIDRKNWVLIPALPLTSCLTPESQLTTLGLTFCVCKMRQLNQIQYSPSDSSNSPCGALAQRASASRGVGSVSSSVCSCPCSAPPIMQTQESRHTHAFWRSGPWKLGPTLRELSGFAFCP